MPSTDLYASAIAFLDGDAGDVRTTVNGEQPSLLAAGSVYVSRGGPGAPARQPKTAAVTVEIVPTKGEWLARGVGIGMKEREIVLELRVIARRKDLAQGRSQIDIVKNAARALVYRYDGVSNLSVPVGGFVSVLDSHWANGQTITITANGTPMPLSPGTNWFSTNWSSLAAIAADLAQLLNDPTHQSFGTTGSQYSGGVDLSALILATANGASVAISPKPGCASLALARTAGTLFEPVSSITTPAKWRRALCRITQIDQAPESGEYARAVVELRMIFTEPTAA